MGSPALHTPQACVGLYIAEFYSSYEWRMKHTSLYENRHFKKNKKKTNTRWSETLIFTYTVQQARFLSSSHYGTLDQVLINTVMFCLTYSVLYTERFDSDLTSFLWEVMECSPMRQQGHTTHHTHRGTCTHTPDSHLRPYTPCLSYSGIRTQIRCTSSGM